MSDEEMMRLCGEAMGWRQHKHSASVLYNEEARNSMPKAAWNPLQDDAQAMALVKKLRLRVAYNIFVGCWVASTLPDNETGDKEARFDESLNAAIVKCAAQAQAKQQSAAGDASLSKEKP